MRLSACSVLNPQDKWGTGGGKPAPKPFFDRWGCA